MINTPVLVSAVLVAIGPKEVFQMRVVQAALSEHFAQA